MKTTFKPKNGSTTMQIEAETDQERALLHARQKLRELSSALSYSQFSLPFL